MLHLLFVTPGPNSLSEFRCTLKYYRIKSAPFSLQASSDGTGCLYLVGCGYNAYPKGSLYAEYPQMGNKQEDRQRRKYRFIVHAEQNALAFRLEEADNLK